MGLVVYLAGQIHDDWRDELANKAKERNLPLVFVGPQTNHDESDDIGEVILGKQPGKLYRDDASAAINNLRTQVLLNKADVVVALFGEQYDSGTRQWMPAWQSRSTSRRSSSGRNP